MAGFKGDDEKNLEKYLLYLRKRFGTYINFNELLSEKHTLGDDVSEEEMNDIIMNKLPKEPKDPNQ
jgi:hypothetical protein